MNDNETINEPNWPEYDCSLHISHNQHMDYYQSVEDAIENGTYDIIDFPDQDEVAACIKNNSVWKIQWYPNNPVGFNVVCAATFQKALELANQ